MIDHDYPLCFGLSENSENGKLVTSVLIFDDDGTVRLYTGEKSPEELISGKWDAIGPAVFQKDIEEIGGSAKLDDRVYFELSETDFRGETLVQTRAKITAFLDESAGFLRLVAVSKPGTGQATMWRRFSMDKVPPATEMIQPDAGIGFPAILGTYYTQFQIDVIYESDDTNYGMDKDEHKIDAAMSFYPDGHVVVEFRDSIGYPVSQAKGSWSPENGEIEISWGKIANITGGGYHRFPVDMETECNTRYWHGQSLPKDEETSSNSASSLFVNTRQCRLEEWDAVYKSVWRALDPEPRTVEVMNYCGLPWLRLSDLSHRLMSLETKAVGKKKPKNHGRDKASTFEGGTPAQIEDVARSGPEGGPKWRQRRPVWKALIPGTWLWGKFFILLVAAVFWFTLIVLFVL